MYVMCDGCGRLIAEQEAEAVLVKHHGRVVRVVAGALVCACGTVTTVVSGAVVPAPDASDAPQNGPSH